MSKLFRQYVLAGRLPVPGATLIPLEVENRFLARLPQAGANDCWELTRCITSDPPPLALRDYTLLQWKAGGRTYSIGAHRYSYLRMRGFIPAGRMICHHCNFKPCVNPNHLYAGDAFDYASDRQRDPVLALRHLERARRSRWSPAAKERAQARVATLGILCEAA